MAQAVLPALSAWVVPSIQGQGAAQDNMKSVVRWPHFSDLEIDYEVSVRVTCGLLKKSGFINAICC